MAKISWSKAKTSLAKTTFAKTTFARTSFVKTTWSMATTACAARVAAAALATALAFQAGEPRASARDYSEPCGAGLKLGEDGGVARALDAVSADAPSETDRCVVGFVRREHKESLAADKRFHPLPEPDATGAWAELLYCKALNWSLEQARVDAKASGAKTLPDYVAYTPLEVAERARRVDLANPTRRDLCFLQHQLALGGLMPPQAVLGAASAEAFAKAAEKIAGAAPASAGAATEAAAAWALAKAQAGGASVGDLAATAACDAMLKAISPEITRRLAPFPDDPDYARPGVARAVETAGPLCFGERRFREAGRVWVLQYVLSANRPDGQRYILPHDNEDVALDVALYSIARYGGGFVAVEAGEKRLHKGQDPNRAFGPTAADARACRQMDRPHPIYTAAAMDIYNGVTQTIFALHTNSDGWAGNGGSGTISIRRTGSSILKPFPALNPIGRLADEDNVVLLADLGPLRRGGRVAARLGLLRSWGVHVIYEAVSKRNNDCSLSNYVLLNDKAPLGYVNVEAENGDLDAHKVMLDFSLQALAQAP